MDSKFKNKLTSADYWEITSYDFDLNAFPEYLGTVYVDRALRPEWTDVEWMYALYDFDYFDGDAEYVEFVHVGNDTYMIYTNNDQDEPMIWAKVIVNR